MKVKLLSLIFVVGLCLVLSSAALYYINSKRALNISGNSANHTLAADGVTLSGITKQGNLYTVELDNVTQRGENFYELNSAIIEHTNRATNTKQKFNIKCKYVTVYYTPKPTANVDYTEQIDKLKFTEGVIITSEDNIAYGDIGEFILQENIVILYGNAALKEKRGYMKGDKVIYQIKTGLFKVIGSTQVIIQ